MLDTVIPQYARQCIADRWGEIEGKLSDTEEDEMYFYEQGFRKCLTLFFGDKQMKSAEEEANKMFCYAMTDTEGALRRGDFLTGWSRCEQAMLEMLIKPEGGLNIEGLIALLTRLKFQYEQFGKKV